MLKWILIGLGAVMLIVAGLGAVGWVFMNRTIDANSPTGQAYANSFKQSFAESCAAEATKAAGAVDEATQAKFGQMCTCAADNTYEAYKDLPPIKLVSLSGDPDAQQKINAIMQQCAHQAGLQ